MVNAWPKGIGTLGAPVLELTHCQRVPCDPVWSELDKWKLMKLDLHDFEEKYHKLKVLPFIHIRETLLLTSLGRFDITILGMGVKIYYNIVNLRALICELKKRDRTDSSFPWIIPY